jgi:hypothetical protein
MLNFEMLLGKICEVQYGGTFTIIVSLNSCDRKLDVTENIWYVPRVNLRCLYKIYLWALPVRSPELMVKEEHEKQI